MIRAAFALICRLFLIAATVTAVVGVVLLAVNFPWLGFLASISGLFHAFRRGEFAGTSHGSARVATADEITRAGLYADDRGQGLIFGRSLMQDRPSWWRGSLGLISPWQSSEGSVHRFFAAFFGGQYYREQLIRVRAFIHVLTVAPAGSGKGVSAVILNLLHYVGNVLVFDPKGEIWERVHRHREERLGLERRCIRLDPGGLHDRKYGPGSTFNPLNLADPKRPDFLATCEDIAAMLVIPDPEEKEKHFPEAARQIITGLFAFLCSQKEPELRTFRAFRHIINDPNRYVAVLHHMKAQGGLLAAQAGKLAAYQGKELAGVMTTIHRFTAFMDDPLVDAATFTSSFPARSIRTGDVDIFMLVPGHLMVTLAPLVRVWAGTLTRYYTRVKPSEAKKLLFVCDEAAVLGKFKPIEEGITLMRGFGLRIWLVFQSLNQLETCYGNNAKTVLANMGVQQYFGICDYDTCEQLSKRIGDATLLIESLNESSGSSWSDGVESSRSTNRGISRNFASHGRRLLTADEIEHLPDWLALTFIRGLHVVPTRLVRYYSSREFRERKPGSGMFGNGAVRRIGLGTGIKTLVVVIASIAFAAAMATIPPARPPASAGWPNQGQSFGNPPLPGAAGYYYNQPAYRLR